MCSLVVSSAGVTITMLRVICSMNFQLFTLAARQPCERHTHTALKARTIVMPSIGTEFIHAEASAQHTNANYKGLCRRCAWLRADDKETEIKVNFTLLALRCCSVEWNKIWFLFISERNAKRRFAAPSNIERSLAFVCNASSRSFLRIGPSSMWTEKSIVTLRCGHNGRHR